MKIQVTHKPFHVSSNSRILYKIIQLLLILYFSRGKKASLSKIHLLIWVLERKERMDLILRSKELEYNQSIGLWGIDKHTNKALLYMFEDKLCDLNKKTYALTDNGKKFIEQIIKDKEVFTDEKNFLKKLGFIREEDITRLERLWVN